MAKEIVYEDNDAASNNWYYLARLSKRKQRKESKRLEKIKLKEIKE